MEVSPKPSLRHCSYCLLEISGAAVKLCGKCHRRAYCGPECQKKDWSTKPSKGNEQRGQGHRVWCDLDVLEEDLDWKIVPVEGKGLGVVALRDIPAKTRVMVDASQPSGNCHPRTVDLMPKGKSLLEKFIFNRLGGGDDNEASCLCLRLSRVNHDCRTNCSHYYDEERNVKILFSDLPIAAGEEITINYTTFNSVCGGEDLEFWKADLKKRGIVCPANCLCNDKDALRAIQRAKFLDNRIANLGHIPSEGLSKVDEILKLQDQFHGFDLEKKRTLYDGFQIAVMSRRYLPRAKDYMKRLHDSMAYMMHPADKTLLEYKLWMHDPSCHDNYLMNE